MREGISRDGGSRKDASREESGEVEGPDLEWTQPLQSEVRPCGLPDRGRAKLRRVYPPSRSRSMAKRSLASLSADELRGKRVLVRVDF
ncbi:MAG: hypothetical protein VKM34_07660, partial [Cyanobacteriota bacterium]|nr:hypothetical protein [Cyanobacteriota bacterium]